MHSLLRQERTANPSGWCCRCMTPDVPTQWGGGLPEWCAACAPDGAKGWFEFGAGASRDAEPEAGHEPRGE